MKKNKIRFGIFLISIISAFLVFVLPAFAANITCTPCNQGNCNCNINICTSGLLTIYKNSDCSGSPVFKIPFTNGAAIWSPDSFGAYYGKALCDDRTTKSDCPRIDVSQISTSCDNDVCNQQCKNQGNVTGVCSSNNQCQCSGVVTEDTCSDGTSYGDCSSEKPKFCSTSGSLTDDCENCNCPDDLPVCKSDGSCAEKPTTSGGDSGIWIWIVIIIVIVAVVAYFI
ncbi:MAG: hypothetical protein V1944_00265, partial [Candidatus Aenigmatarchaeota archaeon]